MPAVMFYRFLRRVSVLAVLAGLLTGYDKGLKIGVFMYIMSLSGSLVAIENIFISASEQLGGKNEPKSDGDVGKSDVTKTGS